MNSNLEPEILGRSELTIPCTTAFNRMLSAPISTKYSFFRLQLNFICLVYHLFQCYDVIISSMQKHLVKIWTNWIIQF